VVFAADGASGTIPHDQLKPLFYGDCTDADVAWCAERLVPQPVQPFTAPVTLTADRFGSVPRTYIECVDDGAISIELQRDMHTASPCQTVIALDASHSPFLSMPAALCDALEKAATR
jgi:hypothetical protein